MASRCTADEQYPQFSPDGRWLAYQSDEGGTLQVYVVAFPIVGRPEQVSVDGGETPRWSAAGDELFFCGPERTLIVSKVSTGAAFGRTTPRPLFNAPDFDEPWNYDVAPDGQHFVLSVLNPDVSAKEIHVVENFFEELKAKVGN